MALAAASVAACGSGDEQRAERAAGTAPATTAAPRASTAAAASAAEAPGFVARLRRGGHVLAFRHAATDRSQSDAQRFEYSDCVRQRNLDARGRAQARAIGRAVRALRVPVGRVLASPYCRTVQTARLAFGRVTPTADLLSEINVRHGEDVDALDDRFRAQMRAAPATRTNTVLVSHGIAINAATGVSLAEGQAAVFRRDGSARGYRFVRTLTAAEWARLARRAGGARAEGGAVQARPAIREFRVPAGSGPHDVAPARDGTVWFTAQRSGHLGRLNPRTGRSRMVALGDGSAPHGVIVGPDGAPWVTDGGLNAIVRVDPRTLRVRRFPLPSNRPAANLNTATFDRSGRLWFTGQSGVYGSVVPRSGRVRAFGAPRGFGPYGISTTPSGQVWYASLAGSYIARIDTATGRARVVQPPTAGQGARRIWPDSDGRLWVSEYNAGRLGRYDPARRRWREWRLPGDDPHPYAVFVDERDIVWLTDFGEDRIVRFDPRTERFTPIGLPTAQAAVRQLLGRTGEVWGAESAADKLVVLRTG
ncbi:MAG TPA: histidine phosphatase family protein [Solirubrobacteraceae bacterium]|nr:histidine phosphatase family protein [Solirubrobacteraceae bacterium]